MSYAFLFNKYIPDRRTGKESPWTYVHTVKYVYLDLRNNSWIYLGSESLHTLTTLSPFSLRLSTLSMQYASSFQEFHMRISDSKLSKGSKVPLDFDIRSFDNNPRNTFCLIFRRKHYFYGRGVIKLIN